MCSNPKKRHLCQGIYRAFPLPGKGRGLVFLMNIHSQDGLILLTDRYRIFIMQVLEYYDTGKSRIIK